MAYDNTNTFVLFKNKDKATEKHPDYKGTLNIEGVEHWASAWVKTSKNGEKFMSGSITPKNANNTRAPVTAAKPALDDLDDGLIPF